MHGLLITATISGSEQREFQQSAGDLSEQARRQYQVVEWRVCRNVEAADELMLVASWDEREGLERYLRSEPLPALLGCLTAMPAIETSPLFPQEGKQ